MQLKLKNLFVMFLIMLFMVGTITAIMTLVNLSPAQPFINTWVNSFIFALVVLLPVGGVLFIGMNKLINQYCLAWSSLQKNLFQGISMAIIMESIIAVVLTVKNGSYESSAQFSQLFFNSLLFALPVGLTLSLVMTLFIKPKLEGYIAKVPA